MSYEGYEQWLCANGHYHIFDAYATPNESTWQCVCDAKLAWRNMVDQTNNGYDNNPDYDDVGHIQPQLLQPSEYEICPTCGVRKIINQARYKIPFSRRGGGS